MPKRQLYSEDPRDVFENLPLLPPQKTFDLLSKHHYKGQEVARKDFPLIGRDRSGRRISVVVPHRGRQISGEMAASLAGRPARLFICGWMLHV
ncbi:MAG: hypothetical protein HYR55_15590 [Acidobacteria bacterium]|nr:hypothetical protein [Acidobacteriota bacterium]MBI3656944.1 hypothetical protein [Acidobacteriota bacterium]